MAGEAILTLIGTLTADPEMRFIPSGAGVVNFTVASNSRRYNRDTDTWEDGDALFMRCNAWRDLATNITDSLSKGDRVIVSGRLKQRSYEKDGQKRTVMELEVDEVGPSLKWATAKPVKNDKSGNGSPSGHQSAQRSATVATGGGGGFDDEPPFFRSERFDGDV